MKEKIERVKRILDKTFPKAHKPERSPLEQAIFTILSQNTTDINAEKCLQNIKNLTGNNLEKLKSYPERKILPAIHPCGLFKQKITAIKELLNRWDELKEKLKTSTAKEGIKLLTSIPYIGSKTARVILTFAFNKNTFPIDTHCKKVLKRLGIFPETWKPDRISEFMEKTFSAEFNRKLHYDLIRVGRTFCKAKNPDCKNCPLKELCSYAERNLLHNIQAQKQTDDNR
ncbi:endonuclease-3 [Desulfurobacterium pacificum]|uniref:Endonuclease-3 n=1 Tax=Desulfurobacterium pacificum TaxID=240166 RepID=A0ABY1NA53_9BACT|nr:hypothetical protein [Desulfurobacterium pacificum]SMP04150.1 endonuclease-3 [Desulfurobacterium pacificum]